MDVRAKQLLSYLRCPLNFGLRAIGFAPRHLNRYAFSLAGERTMIFRASILLLCILISFVCVSAQEKSSEARKFNEIGRMIADAEMTRLDAFALELNKNQSSSGYIIGYSKPDDFSGYFLRTVYG
jgi:hypothetical protein